jgi:hypothetical protein
MTKTALLLLVILISLILLGGTTAYRCKLDLHPNTYVAFFVEANGE